MQHIIFLENRRSVTPLVQDPEIRFRPGRHHICKLVYIGRAMVGPTMGIISFLLHYFSPLSDPTSPNPIESQKNLISLKKTLFLLKSSYYFSISLFRADFFKFGAI